MKWSFWTHCPKANGPVPIGCELLASVATPLASKVDGAGTMPTWAVSVAGKDTHGVFMSNSRVSGPVVFTAVTSENTGPVRALAMKAL